jgi:hypothetical protein
MATTVASFENMFWRDSPDGVHFSVEDSAYVAFVTLYTQANLIGTFVSPGKAFLVRRITLALVEEVILRSREWSTLQDDGYQWKMWMSIHGTIRCIPCLFASKDFALNAYCLAQEELKSNSAPAGIGNAACWNMFSASFNTLGHATFGTRQVAKTCVRQQPAVANRVPREVLLTNMETDRRAPDLPAGIVMDTNPFSFALEAVEPCPLTTPFDIMLQEWREWKLFFHACRHQAAEMVTCPSMASAV